LIVNALQFEDVGCFHVFKFEYLKFEGTLAEIFQFGSPKAVFF